MKSMTGFGRATANLGGFDVSIDISSVNRKGLEASCGLPKEWAGAERLVISEVKNFFTRGKVNVAIRVNFKDANSSFCSNADVVANALEKMKKVCEQVNVEFKPNFDDLMTMCFKLSDTSQTSDDFEDSVWKSLESVLNQALQNIDAMRIVEGKALADDILSRLATLSKFVDDIKSASKTTVLEYKNQLLQRLKNLDLNIDLSDERFLKEISLFADKCDISEEITRLSSHICQFETCVKSNENLGRKMDFICQEIGREINTIGSKANNLALTKIVIDFKNELERIREQVQNVE